MQKDVTKAVRSFQLAGQDVGAEETIYAMKDFDTDATLLIDA